MAERAPRRPRLDVPQGQRHSLRAGRDPDAFGRASERIASFLGTSKFLVYLTVIVIVWLAWNTFAPVGLQFDPRALNYTLLTLLLSLQASYAAPLILLAQNRQTDRDRVSLEEDRAQNARLMAEVEYLSRELAALRQTVGEVVTRDFLREQLREHADEVVGRTGAPPTGEPFDEARRVEREERKRRQERKRRAKAQREKTDRDTDGRTRESAGSLTEPFAGEIGER